uniref:ClbS/DfsB family four-helix bundle protein n=1 Tax=Thermosporothrix sp. COM3 TaxID=2490863 RepID=A0A455SSR2_9CHLR|nr:hypothetical protein KTC_39360 [Thermosporothrix sp. COM3]
MPADPITKAELLRKIQEGHDALKTFLAQFDEQQLQEPGVNGEWSIKDNIAHLSAWHKRLIDDLAAARAGITPEDRDQGLDIDGINERIFQENRHRSLADVQQEFEDTYAQTVQSVEQTPEEMLNQPPCWTDKYLLWELVDGNTFSHYQEHTEYIQNWLQRKAAQ